MEQTVGTKSAAKEHVSEINRYICTVKERSHAVASTLTFQYLHKLIVTKIVYFAVLWINYFPVKHGVSTKYSLRAIVSHTKLIWKKHCKVVFYTYCEVNDEPHPSTLMVTRTHKYIALDPTRNLQET